MGDIVERKGSFQAGYRCPLGIKQKDGRCKHSVSTPKSTSRGHECAWRCSHMESERCWGEGERGGSPANLKIGEKFPGLVVPLMPAIKSPRTLVAPRLVVQEPPTEPGLRSKSAIQSRHVV